MTRRTRTRERHAAGRGPAAVVVLRELPELGAVVAVGSGLPAVDQDEAQERERLHRVMRGRGYVESAW